MRLLDRTTRSVSPTEAGEQLLTRLVPALRDLDAALDAVAGAQGQPSGTLRINGNESAIRLLLQTAVPRCLARHPGMPLTWWPRVAWWTSSIRASMPAYGLAGRCRRT
ncbi:MAG: hypothetical protein ACRYGL_05560 [Janthinobacterium lividum]